MLPTSRFILMAAAAVTSLGIAAYGSVAGASTIFVFVSDGFSGTNGALVAGRTPDGWDIPSTTWEAQSQGGTAYPMTLTTSTGNPSPSVNTNFNDAAGINIASADGYLEPSAMTISADLNMGNIGGGGLSYNVYGVGLGFWNALPASGTNASSGFTGITMDPYGDLTFINNGTASATTKAAAPTGYISGGFNSLAYSIDTGTGAITQVTFDGTDLTSNFSGVTAFTPSVAALAGFYGNSPDSVSENGYVDNFSLSTPGGVYVPDPATLSLVAIGGLSLLLFGSKQAGRRRV